MEKALARSFFRACTIGDANLVSELLSAGIDPEVRDSFQLTGLIWAGRKGQIAAAEALISAGASLETPDVRGRTALFHAVTYARYEFVGLLAAQGANLNPIDTHGWSPLDFSTTAHNKRMASLLESLGATHAKHERFAPNHYSGVSCYVMWWESWEPMRQLWLPDS